MFPNFIKNHSIRSGKSSSTDASPKNELTPSNGGSGRAAGSVNDFMTKSGQFFTSIQGTLDKQLGQIVEAVQSAATFDAVELSAIPVVNQLDFEPYLALVREHWGEYKSIVSSLTISREKSLVEEGGPIGAFREIPQVFFNTDYKESGFHQHQIFTQPLRVSLQNQGKINSQLSTYLKAIDSHLVRHLSNVDSLLRSLMTIATIQSDVAAAHDRVVAIRGSTSANKEIVTGLEVHCLARRRSRLLTLLSLLEEVDKVSQAKPGVDAFVAQGDFATGMELIQATQNILANKLGGLKMTERIASVIQEHGRHIDGDMEAEFVQLVMSIFEDNAETKNTILLKSMLKSMADRALLVPCIQMRLRETLVRSLRERLKQPRSLALLFDTLHAFLARLCELVLLVDLRGSSDPIQRLTSLRLFEFVTVSGLAKISQEMGHQTTCPLPELETLLETKTSDMEKMYLGLFAETLGLGEHVSFGSSIIGAGSQNGFSPDVFATLFAAGSAKLAQIDQTAIAFLEHEFGEEKWDKSVSPGDAVLQFISLLEGAVKDDEVSPVGPVRVVRVGRVNFLMVPAGLAFLEKMAEYLDVVLICPELGKIIDRMRWANNQVREAVLEGQMGVKFKKPINATNLALASQQVGIMAQVALLIAKKISERFGIDTGLVVLDETPKLSPMKHHTLVLATLEQSVCDLAQGVVMELNEHRMEIFFKLSDILISRFEFHLTKWLSSDDTLALEGIVKDFSQMYKVLLKSLQTDNLKRVFARAFNESTHRFRAKLETSTPSRHFKSDLLFLYQGFLASESMVGLKSSLSSMIEEMLEAVEQKGLDGENEEATTKLKALLE